MRINELLNEMNQKREKLRKGFSQASPNHTSYDSLDNNNHPYMAYRFGIALATSPDTNMDPRGPIGSDFQVIDYSDADAEIRKGAEKIMGLKPSRSTGRGSEELESTGIVSPVANWMKPTKEKKAKKK